MTRSLATAAVAVALALALLSGGAAAKLVVKKCYLPTQRVACGDETCNVTSRECMPCTATEPCWDRALYCDAPKGLCEVTPVAAMWQMVLLVAVIVIVVCTVGVVAGVGGGGILTPLYAGVLGLPIADAVTGSLTTIVGQALVNVPVLLRNRHPKVPGRLLPNMQLLALWYPAVSAGGLVGSLCSNFVPDWVRLLFLFVLTMVIIARLVYHIARQRKRDEADAATALLDATATDHEMLDYSPDSPVKPLAAADRGTDYGSDAGRRTPVAAAAAPAEVDNNRGEAGPEAKPPALELLLLAICAVVSSLCAALMFLPGTRCGGFRFWAYFFTALLVNALVSIGYRMHLQTRQHRIEAGMEDPGVITFNWTFTSVWVLPNVAGVAGFGSSLLGIGGGSILNPLLLEVGLEADESSATSGLATALIAVQGILAGMGQHRLAPGLTVIFVLCGLTSTLTGRYGLLRYIKKRGWKSMIVVALAVIHFLTITSVLIYGVIDIMALRAHGAPLGFGTLCPDDS
jgi:uncharacterized membrane protein YfcA